MSKRDFQKKSWCLWTNQREDNEEFCLPVKQGFQSHIFLWKQVLPTQNKIACYTSGIRKCKVTFFSKRNATLICPFSLVLLGQRPWHRCCGKSRCCVRQHNLLFNVPFNGVFGKLLSWALSKWCITPDSLVYTLLQKKGNLKNVAFLLEKSVSIACFWFWHK